MQMWPNPAGPPGLRHSALPAAPRGPSNADARVPTDCRGGGKGQGGAGRGCWRGWLAGAPSNHLSPEAFFPATLSSTYLYCFLPLTPRSLCLSVPRIHPCAPHLNLVSLSGAGVVWPRPRWDRSGTRSPLTPSRRQRSRSTLPSAGRPRLGITRISVLRTIEAHPVLTWL